METEFYESSGELCCADCGGEITLAQYRRKTPRCDDCEVAFVTSLWWTKKETPSEMG